MIIGRILFIIIFILMDVAFVYILVTSIKDRRLANNKICAHFKRFEKHSARRQFVNLNPVFSFEYNGKSYSTVESKETSTFAERRRFKNGGKSATYTIWIDPKNPYHCYHRRMIHLVNFLYVLECLIFITLGVFCTYYLISMVANGS